ncbi:flagellar protein export ATPase FliI [Tumebacillus permanentifrigoris]|uniref:Flagellum-specific ATP synthase n=1 Tax=Tumebacillus permanentifrigoris TaxID=378543 RepID=A0A316DUH8_9BACL|nr:flagellar protein export ATPase FliI [Tumebacillus permanentifrigoris]PWK12712.1 flagellum-specific ATP synthase [Tumebacillus permanentifrigoris]
MSQPLKLERYLRRLDRTRTIKVNGKVSKVIGLTIESKGPVATIGDVCTIESEGAPSIYAEVVGFRENNVLLMPLGELGAIGPGHDVVATGSSLQIPVGPHLLGRVLNGLGEPIDGKGPLDCREHVSAMQQPPNPLTRKRILEPLSVGVRCIDGLLTVGRGQRVGLFAGSGVGKSTLLGMMARNTTADINVIALIGERGREVREFIEKDLGEEGLKRSVLVVATSDQPPLVRIKGAMVATSIAEYFRDQGQDVVLMMDSVTRFAMAQREVGLAVGEPPTTRGYTPSVFALLPRLLERAGTGHSGTITAFYTVLVDGDDMNEPVADAVRGILDGHIVLSRSLANRGHFPAIDVLASVSRVMNELVTPEHRRAANTVKKLSSIYKESEDLINIGAYQRGSNLQIDRAIQFASTIESFTTQDVHEKMDLEHTQSMLIETFGGIDA